MGGRRRSFTPRRRSLIPEDFSVSPSPLGTYWAFELNLTGLWLDLGGLGTKGLGLGFDNIVFSSIPKVQEAICIYLTSEKSMKSSFNLKTLKA